MEATFEIRPGKQPCSVEAIVNVMADGKPLGKPTWVDCWLSANPRGQGITPTPPSGQFKHGCFGTDLLRLQPLLLKGQTDEGRYSVSLTDTERRGYFIAVTLPCGALFVSRKLVEGDYLCPPPPGPDRKPPDYPD